MATTKPTKPTNEFLPNGFATSGTKANFSSAKIETGFSANIADILQGDNLNYTLDTIGLQLKYLTDVVDYLVAINNGKIPYVNGDGKFDSGDINTFLPSQTGNSGKFLTTNGSVSSWSASLTEIGDPIFTLNFNKTLSSDYMWLEGQVVSKTTYPELFAIYGYAYDTSFNGDTFRLPNFTNCTIWGGTTAGKIEAGLPNITGSFHGASQSASAATGAFYKLGSGTKVHNDGEKDNIYGFNANLGATTRGIYGNSNTVQPPAIKVRAYTRVR